MFARPVTHRSQPYLWPRQLRVSTFQVDALFVSYIFSIVTILLLTGCNPGGPALEYTGALSTPDSIQSKSGVYFGHAIALDGGRAVVGAPDIASPRHQGTAYVFERQPEGPWSKAVELIGASVDPGDEFGRGVAISGDYAVVGAPEDSMRYTAQGAVYIFERQSTGDWVEVARVSSADAAIADNEFGTSVDLEGSRMLVGATRHAYRRYAAEQRTGAAYIFERQSDGTWVQVAKLMASDSDREAVDPNGDWTSDWRRPPYTRAFGADVSLSGDWALIGTTNTRGEAYLFKREGESTWVPIEKFAPSGQHEDSKSTTRVSIADSLAIMGFLGEGDVDGGSPYGAVDIYELGSDQQWTGPTRLALPDSSNLAFFGRDVALAPPYAFVRANRRFSDSPENIGGVYVYERKALGEWRLVSQVSPAADTSISGYSHRLSASSTGIIIQGERDRRRTSQEVFHFEMHLP